MKSRLSSMRMTRAKDNKTHSRQQGEEQSPRLASRKLSCDVVCVVCVCLTVLHGVRHGVAGDGVEADDVQQRADAVGGNVLLVVLVEAASPQTLQTVNRETVHHTTAKERSGSNHGDLEDDGREQMRSTKRTSVRQGDESC